MSNILRKKVNVYWYGFLLIGSTNEVAAAAGRSVGRCGACAHENAEHLVADEEDAAGPLPAENGVHSLLARLAQVVDDVEAKGPLVAHHRLAVQALLAVDGQPLIELAQPVLQRVDGQDAEDASGARAAQEELHKRHDLKRLAEAHCVGEYASNEKDEFCFSFNFSYSSHLLLLRSRATISNN